MPPVPTPLRVVSTTNAELAAEDAAAAAAAAALVTPQKGAKPTAAPSSQFTPGAPTLAPYFPLSLPRSSSSSSSLLAPPSASSSQHRSPERPLAMFQTPKQQTQLRHSALQTKSSPRTRQAGMPETDREDDPQDAAMHAHADSSYGRRLAENVGGSRGTSSAAAAAVAASAAAAAAATAERDALLETVSASAEQLSTPSMIEARRALRAHPKVVAWIEVYWRTFPCKSTLGITKQQYLAQHALMFKALHATYDPKEAYEQGQNDWARDVWFSSSPHYLDAESFGDALFEVVDLWTLTVSAEEYVHFLADLYHRITDLRSWIEPHPSNRIVTKFMWRRLRHTQVATQVYQPFQYKAVASETWKDAVDVAHLMDDSAGSQMKSSKALLLAAQRAKLFNNGVSPAAFQASQMLQSPPKKPESDDEDETAAAAAAPATPAETAAEARRRKQAAAKKKAIAASNTSLQVARELDPTQILALLPEVELSPPDAEFLSPPAQVPGPPRAPMFSDPMMELGIAVLNTAEEDGEGDGEADGLGADWGDDGNEEEPEEELAWGAAPSEKKTPKTGKKKKLSKDKDINLDDIEEPTDAEIEAFLASNPTGLVMPADGVAKGRDAHLKALLLGQARTVLKQRKRDAAIALASQIRQRIEAAQERERIANGGAPGEIVGASEGQAARHGAEPSKTQFDFSGLPLPGGAAKPGGRNLNFGLALPPRRGSGLGLGLGSLNASGKVLSAEEIARRKADFEAGQAEEAERQRVAAAEEAEKAAELERAAAKQRQYEEDHLPPQELADRNFLRDELPPSRTIEEPLSPEQRPRWHGHSKRYSFLVPQTPSSSACPIVTPHSAQLALARKRGSAMVSNTGFNKRGAPAAPASMQSPQQPQLGTWSRMSAPQRPRAMSWPPLDMRASDLNEQPPSLERLMSGQAKADAAVKARAAAVAERANRPAAAESESSDEEESAPGKISSQLLQRPRPNSGGARRLSPASSRRGSFALGSPLSLLHPASSRRRILLGAGIGLSSKPPPFASIAACHEHAPATGFTSRQRTPLVAPRVAKKPKKPAKPASAIAEEDEEDLGDLVPAPPEQLESDDEDAEAELNDSSLTELERQKKAAQREVDDFVKQMDARRRARRPSRVAAVPASPVAGSLAALSAASKYTDAPIEIDPSAQDLYDAPPPGALLFDDSDDELDGAPRLAPFDLDEQLSYTPRGRHAAGCPSPNSGLRALDGLRRVDLQRAMGLDWVWGQVGVGRQRLIVSLPPNTWDKIWYLQGKIQEADAAASARRAAKLRKQASMAAQGKGKGGKGAKGHNRKQSESAPLQLTAKQIETNAALKAVADRHAAMEAAAAKALAEKDAPVESSEDSEDEAEAAAAFAALSAQDWEQAGAIWSAKYEKRWKASVCQSMADWAREHEARVEKRAQALGQAANESAEDFAARRARESAESSAQDKLFWSAIADQEAQRRMEKALKAQQQAIVLAAMEPPAPVVDPAAEAAAAAEAKANKRKSKRSTAKDSGSNKLTVVKKKHDRASKNLSVPGGDIKEDEGESAAADSAAAPAATGDDGNTLTLESGDGSAGSSPIGSPKTKGTRKAARSVAMRKARSASGNFGPDGAPLPNPAAAIETAAAEGGDDTAAATAGAGGAAPAADGKRKTGVKKKKKKVVVVTAADGTAATQGGTPDAGSPDAGSPTPGSPVPKRKTLKKKAAAAANAAAAVAALEKLAAETAVSPTAAAAAAAAAAGTDHLAPAVSSSTASSRRGSAGAADPAAPSSSLGDDANVAPDSVEGALPSADATAAATAVDDDDDSSDSDSSSSDSGASLHGRVLSSAEPSRAATPVPADPNAEGDTDGTVTGESQFPSEWPSEKDSETDGGHGDPNDPALAGAGSSVAGEKRMLSRIQSASSEQMRRSKPGSAASVGPNKSPSRSPQRSPEQGPQDAPLDGAVPEDGLKPKKKSRKRQAREAAAAAAAAALIAPADGAAAVDGAAATGVEGDASRTLSVAGSKRDSRVPSAANRAPRKAVLAGPIHGVLMNGDDQFEGGDEDGAAILASGAVSARGDGDEPQEIEDSGLNADGEPRFEAPEDSAHWTAEEKRAYRETEAQLDRQRKLLTMHAEGDMARTEFQWAMRKEEIKDDEVLAAEARRKIEAAQAKEAALLAAEEKKRLAEQKQAEKLAAEVRAKAAAEIAKREAKEAAAQREIKRKAAVAAIMAAAEKKRRDRAEARAARVAAAEAAGVELSEEEDTTAADAAELEAALAEHAPPPPPPKAAAAGGKKKVLGIKPKSKTSSTLKVAGDSAGAEGSDGDAAAASSARRKSMRKSGGLPAGAAAAVADKRPAVNPNAAAVTPDHSAPTSPAGSGLETIDPATGLPSPQLSPDGSLLPSAASTRPGSSNLMQPGSQQGQAIEEQFEEDGVTPKPGSPQRSRGQSVDVVSGSASALTSSRMSGRGSIHGTPLGSALRSPTGSVGSGGSGGVDGDGNEFTLPAPAIDGSEDVAALLSALAGSDSGLRNAASGILTPERRQSLLRGSSNTSSNGQRGTAASKHATPGSTRPGTAQLFNADGTLQPQQQQPADDLGAEDGGLSGDEMLQSGGDESPVEEDEGAVLTDSGQHVIMPDGSRQPSRASTRASTRASSASAIGGSPKVRRSRPPTGNATPALSEHGVSARGPQSSSRRTTALTHPPFAPEDPSLAVSVEPKRILSRPSTGRALSPQTGPVASPKDPSRPATAAEVAAAAAIALPGSPVLSSTSSIAPSKRATLTGAKSPPVGSSKKLAPSKRASGRASGSSSKSPKKAGKGKKKEKFVLEAEQYVPSEDEDDDAPVNFDDDIDALTGWSAIRGSKDSIGGSLPKPHMTPKTAAAATAAAPPAEELDVWASTPAIEMPEEPAEPEIPAAVTTVTVEEAQAAPAVDDTLEDEVAQTTPGGTPIPSARSSLKDSLSRPVSSGVTAVVISSRKSSANSLSRQSSALPQVSESNDAAESAGGEEDQPEPRDDLIMTESGLLVPRALIDPLSMQHSLENSQRSVRMPATTPTSSAVAPMIRVLGFAAPPRDDLNAAATYEPREWDGIDPLAEAKRLRRLNKSAGGTFRSLSLQEQVALTTETTLQGASVRSEVHPGGSSAGVESVVPKHLGGSLLPNPLRPVKPFNRAPEPLVREPDPPMWREAMLAQADHKPAVKASTSGSVFRTDEEVYAVVQERLHQARKEDLARRRALALASSNAQAGAASKKSWALWELASGKGEEIAHRMGSFHARLVEVQTKKAAMAAELAREVWLASEESRRKRAAAAQKAAEDLRDAHQAHAIEIVTRREERDRKFHKEAWQRREIAMATQHLLSPGDRVAAREAFLANQAENHAAKEAEKARLRAQKYEQFQIEWQRTQQQRWSQEVARFYALQRKQAELAQKMARKRGLPVQHVGVQLIVPESGSPSSAIAAMLGPSKPASAHPSEGAGAGAVLLHIPGLNAHPVSQTPVQALQTTVQFPAEDQQPAEEPIEQPIVESTPSYERVLDASALGSLETVQEDYDAFSMTGESEGGASARDANWHPPVETTAVRKDIASLFGVRPSYIGQAPAPLVVAGGSGSNVFLHEESLAPMLNNEGTVLDKTYILPRMLVQPVVPLSPASDPAAADQQAAVQESQKQILIELMEQAKRQVQEAKRAQKQQQQEAAAAAMAKAAEEQAQQAAAPSSPQPRSPTKRRPVMPTPAPKIVAPGSLASMIPPTPPMEQLRDDVDEDSEAAASVLAVRPIQPSPMKAKKKYTTHAQMRRDQALMQAQQEQAEAEARKARKAAAAQVAAEVAAADARAEALASARSTTSSTASSHSHSHPLSPAHVSVSRTSISVASASPSLTLQARRSLLSSDVSSLAHILSAQNIPRDERTTQDVSTASKQAAEIELVRATDPKTLAAQRSTSKLAAAESIKSELASTKLEAKRIETERLAREAAGLGPAEDVTAATVVDAADLAAAKELARNASKSSLLSGAGLFQGSSMDEWLSYINHGRLERTQRLHQAYHSLQAQKSLIMTRKFQAFKEAQQVREKGLLRSLEHEAAVTAPHVQDSQDHSHEAAEEAAMMAAAARISPEPAQGFATPAGSSSSKSRAQSSSSGRAVVTPSVAALASPPSTGSNSRPQSSVAAFTPSSTAKTPLHVLDPRSAVGDKHKSLTLEGESLLAEKTPSVSKGLQQLFSPARVLPKGAHATLQAAAIAGLASSPAQREQSKREEARARSPSRMAAKDVAAPPRSRSISPHRRSPSPPRPLPFPGALPSPDAPRAAGIPIAQGVTASGLLFPQVLFFQANVDHEEQRQAEAEATSNVMGLQGVSTELHQHPQPAASSNVFFVQHGPPIRGLNPLSPLTRVDPSKIHRSPYTVAGAPKPSVLLPEPTHPHEAGPSEAHWTPTNPFSAPPPPPPVPIVPPNLRSSGVNPNPATVVVRKTVQSNAPPEQSYEAIIAASVESPAIVLADAPVPLQERPPGRRTNHANPHLARSSSRSNSPSRAMMQQPATAASSYHPKAATSVTSPLPKSAAAAPAPTVTSPPPPMMDRVPSGSRKQLQPLEVASSQMSPSRGTLSASASAPSLHGNAKDAKSSPSTSPPSRSPRSTLQPLEGGAAGLYSPTGHHSGFYSPSGLSHSSSVGGLFASPAPRRATAGAALAGPRSPSTSALVFGGEEHKDTSSGGGSNIAALQAANRALRIQADGSRGSQSIPQKSAATKTMFVIEPTISAASKQQQAASSSSSSLQQQQPHPHPSSSPLKGAALREAMRQRAHEEDLRQTAALFASTVARTHDAAARSASNNHTPVSLRASPSSSSASPSNAQSSSQQQQHSSFGAPFVIPRLLPPPHRPSPVKLLMQHGASYAMGGHVESPQQPPAAAKSKNVVALATLPRR